MQRINQRLNWKTYQIGQQIIDRDQTSTDVYLILEGQARVVNYAITGREISFDELTAGDLFGYLSALDGMPRSATVVPLARTKVAIISGNDFVENVILAHPETALYLLRGMARSLRQTTMRIMDLTTLGANNRIFGEVLRLARARIRPDHSALLDPFPSHSDIAARACTTRETATRAVSILVRNKLLMKAGHGLVVTDCRKLAEMVHEVQS